jgi:hypothetical protein
MKVFKKKTLQSFCTFAMFLMETTAEIWRLRFFNLFWKSVELGPYYPFYTKILCRNRNRIFQVKKFKTIAPTSTPPPPKQKKDYLFQNVCPQNPYRKQHVLRLWPKVYMKLRKREPRVQWNVYRMLVIGLRQINLGIINQSTTHACLFQDRIGL